MSEHYFDVVLTISRDKNSDRILVSIDYSPEGAAKGEGRFDLQGLQRFHDSLQRLAIQRRRDLLTNATSLTNETSLSLPDLNSIGGSLCSALPLEVQVKLAANAARARAERKRVRLKLDIQDPVVARLPWEALLLDQRKFLALSENWSIVRWPTRDLQVEVLSDCHLRVLVVYASPASTAPVPAADTELIKLEELFRELAEVSYKQLRSDSGNLVTLQTILDTIDDANAQGEPFHVLHVVSHGRFDDQAGQGFLIFENEEGGRADVSETQLANTLGNRHLRLIVLNACHGADLGESNALGGIAASLLQAGVPAVIGMQFPITGLAAAAFAGKLYRTVLGGKSVDVAVSHGRQAILARDESSSEWITPVLYASYLDGALVVVSRSIFTPRRIKISAMVAVSLICLLLVLLVVIPSQLNAGWRCPNVSTVVYPNELKEMISIPAMTFSMGDNDTPGASPMSPVVITRSFQIDRFEVANLQYDKFLQSNPQEGASSGASPYHPAVHVDWAHANAYCNSIGKRLPTEAEWELACRSATGQQFAWGNGSLPLRYVMNTLENSCGAVTPVGAFSPHGDSPFGVADMSGNASEWVSDKWSPYPYDQRQSERSRKRVVRGGSYYFDHNNARCSSRVEEEPETITPFLGFRCAKDVR